MNADIEKENRVQGVWRRLSELAERRRQLGWPDRGSTELMIEEMRILQELVNLGCGQNVSPGAAFSVAEMLADRKRVIQERIEKCS